MKLIKRRPRVNEEESITIVTHKETEITRRIEEILTKRTLSVSSDNLQLKIDTKDVYYIESVDFKSFIYTRTGIYLSKMRLYELENNLPQHDFMRINRQSILNIRKIESVSSAGAGRVEVRLKNDDRLIVSRQYAPILKEKFGL